ncbi:AIR synthase related protein [Mesobacillus selenatarsenatis]|uniref:Predicted alpha-ribazole-5-phosphate synthase CblS for cobalamin biosynthesis n=1 Tax=Mesobacillus selenatarsenatis (strain DSM 18680 / JCM 14380 / FERM P-15431 / SF-1) TaxID=1321606 RepID=A0A0A8WYY5_MESS1|nr:AIR synthase related protein [Mesobacillus selenatarsenatis]GAM12209.1 predicted alpha-ribazole-5-phosphate synthase CblS for cobalamin biosynthesis [Mesobacillus selenatarsenatis SF-1]
MRDILMIPLTGNENLVIASDNSGSIGLKEWDAVQVPYETVAYYSFRVAVMECMSAGAEPIAVTLQNFCGEDAWDVLLKGIKQGIAELGKPNISITGSTESNFSMNQSAVGITVIGKTRGRKAVDQLTFTNQTNIAVIGRPLVGQEVVEREAEVVPLAVFERICGLQSVATMPVGSKGILFELNSLFADIHFTEENLVSNLNLSKSSGPSTCFIAVYPESMQLKLISEAGGYYHEIHYLG